ncbi:hypothetical protein [uncultured Methanocorpusculum sp.]|nr:hypothetical protein [uncultured Methanocorpusculum sp.]
MKIVLTNKDTGQVETITADFIATGAERAPYGIGTGITGTGFHDYGDETKTTSAANSTNSGQWFGNYYLYAETVMTASDEALGALLQPRPANDLETTYTRPELFDLPLESWNQIVKKVWNSSEDTSGEDTTNWMFINAGVAGTLINGLTLEDGDKLEPQSGWVLNRATGATITGVGTTMEWSSFVTSGDVVAISITYLPSGQTLFTTETTVA